MSRLRVPPDERSEVARARSRAQEPDRESGRKLRTVKAADTAEMWDAGARNDLAQVTSRLRTWTEIRKDGGHRYDWYLRDLLLKGRLTFVAGPYGAGKTTVVVDIIAHAILGKNWRRHLHQNKKVVPDKSPVSAVFVSAEGGIGPQLVAWEEVYGKLPGDQIIPWDEFSWSEDGSAQRDLEIVLKKMRPSILVFDTHNAVGFTETDPALWSELADFPTETRPPPTSAPPRAATSPLSDVWPAFVPAGVRLISDSLPFSWLIGPGQTKRWSPDDVSAASTRWAGALRH